MNVLADANKELEATSKADQQAEKTDSKDKKADKKETVSADVPEVVVVSEPKTVTYTHVDVLL